MKAFPLKQDKSDNQLFAQIFAKQPISVFSHEVLNIFKLYLGSEIWGNPLVWHVLVILHLHQSAFGFIDFIIFIKKITHKLTPKMTLLYIL